MWRRTRVFLTSQITPNESWVNVCNNCSPTEKTVSPLPRRCSEVENGEERSWEHVNTQSEKTVVWAGGGGVGTETDQSVLLLYHLGRESWHGIRRHPASLAQHCRLRAKQPPLCTPRFGCPSLAQPCSARLVALSKIAHPCKAWRPLQVCTCTEDTDDLFQVHLCINMLQLITLIFK